MSPRRQPLVRRWLFAAALLALPAMRGGGWALVGAALLLCVWLRVAAGVRVDCSQVISRINRETRASGGQAPDMSRIAKLLRTSPYWVEHCMLTYGRRPSRPGRESAETREERLEMFEEEEPEESAPEDVQEPGARERAEFPEKPRRLKIRPTPTPEFLRQ